MKGIQRTVKRRRNEQKTDYNARLGLLSSNKPRVVVRKTNRYIIGQVIVSNVAQDKVVVSVTSKELLGMGWPQSLHGSLKGLAAAYLTGVLLAKKSEIKEAVLDMGMQRNVSGGRVYAFLKGTVDGGLKIPHGSKALPDNAKLEGNNKTRETFIKLKEELIKHGGKGNKK